MNKQQAVEALKALLHDKETGLKKEIEALQTSMTTDTKSSAGDKFETGREMMRAELDKAQNQYLQLTEQLQDIHRIALNEKHAEAGFGSLVQTKQGYYLLSIGLGRFKVADQSCFALSLASPIGKLLRGKQVGETISFQGRAFEILSLE